MNLLPVEIRRATLDDYQSVSALLRALDALHIEMQPHIFELPESDVRTIENLRPFFEEDEKILFLAIHSGKPVGVIDAEILPFNPHAVFRKHRVVYIQNFYVEPEVQSRGVGTQLLEAAQSWAKVRGAGAIQVGSVAENQRARDFYCNAGYSEISIRFQKVL